MTHIAERKPYSFMKTALEQPCTHYSFKRVPVSPVYSHPPSMKSLALLRFLHIASVISDQSVAAGRMRATVNSKSSGVPA